MAVVPRFVPLSGAHQLSVTLKLSSQDEAELDVCVPLIRTAKTTRLL
jgi:hypothetical protein